jgi:ATP-dependent Lhr-like helicase
MVDHDWTEFTPIQEAAIPTMLDGNGALLIAPTAAGKTEAAFLPILSEIQRLKLRPISLLYISPLRALVNDQTRRARSLLEECGLRVGWWHSDLPARDRKKLLAYVPDALFTTPESIEVILSSDAYGHGVLLGDVRYVVIDEIHAFATDDRGAQLMSLLARIEAHKRTPLVRVALSATVNNPDAVASWMASDRQDSPRINVVKDLSARTRRLAVGGLGLSDEDSAGTQTRKAVQVIRKHSEGLRTIVFVNSRKDAEAITLALREAGALARVHHGSIHREERQRVEESFRQEDESIIVATSTLELGIDIGDMDLVMQIGVPYSALSLLQRIGRSGRRAGREAVGVVYAIQDQDLPTCLAGADLALRGDVEDVHPQTAALQVLFHQIIQLAREKDRTSLDEIRELVHSSGSFRELDSLEVNDLVDEMLSMRFLETERGWIRVGYETERRFGALIIGISTRYSKLMWNGRYGRTPK